MWTMETLIRMRKCANSFESKLGAYVRGYIFDVAVYITALEMRLSNAFVFMFLPGGWLFLN